jgi:hypothetical protein
VLGKCIETVFTTKKQAIQTDSSSKENWVLRLDFGRDDGQTQTLYVHSLANKVCALHTTAASTWYHSPWHLGVLVYCHGVDRNVAFVQAQPKPRAMTAIPAWRRQRLAGYLP